MKVGQVEVDPEAIADYCRRWHVAELSLFGSALRDDFRPDSDVDVLVHFGPGGGITWDTMCPMNDELSALFGGRKIDLVERRLVTNPYRRYEMLTHREIIYAA